MVDTAGPKEVSDDGGSGRPGLPKKRRWFSSHTVTQRESTASCGPSVRHRRSSAERSSDAELEGTRGASTTRGTERWPVSANAKAINAIKMTIAMLRESSGGPSIGLASIAAEHRDRAGRVARSR